MNVIIGGGGSAVGVVGVEGSGGIAINLGDDTNELAVGGFVSGGAGVGGNISADVFFGITPGSISDMNGTTKNMNIVAGFWSMTFLVDPDTGEFKGFTFGWGPSYAPFGISFSGSVTAAGEFLSIPNDNKAQLCGLQKND